ncbi:MAG: D-alanyl-lipoteichoic acid biosynthesis protein DltD [Oscillospiraceae bacterium]|nr:D-alanyl-lipoteichoic acid biosynthesis protein DltD [Oscillospiraceae bacterium]
MKLLKIIARALVLPVLVLLTFLGVAFAITAAVPEYKDSAGDDNYTQKIRGLYLLGQSAAKSDNIIIYGSSELRTLEISTNPANFFAGKRAGFQVNLIGRGSCQSLTHAMSIAASGDSLTGGKVVLITSPQSYVKDGIAADLFMANFSAQQYLELMADDGLSPEIKKDISRRAAELLGQYKALHGSAGADNAVMYLAQHNANPGAISTLRNAVTAPYYSFMRYAYGLKDKAASGRLLESLREAEESAPLREIDWAREESAAIEEARLMTGNNDFGILDDYYTTYIGTRLGRQKDKDAGLDYSVSKEYGDLRILFEVCRQKGIEPLFVHVPLHGQWSDYTGFTAQRRQAYYENVKKIAEEYAIEILDLTGYEYEQYFLCDIMHLGWKGWLEVDKALVGFYNSR